MNDRKAATGYFPDEKRAVLRPDSAKGSPELTVDFQRRGMFIELRRGGDGLLGGECNPLVTIDGRRRPLTADWEEVCWITDEDADYLELDCALGNGWSIQRQIVLARDDMFLCIADAVLAPGAKRIHYECSYPLGPLATFKTEEETCDGRVCAGRASARVLPLALPEWRSQNEGSSLSEREQSIVLSQSQTGCRLFAPLFIDLHLRRRRHEATWRRLTVGKLLQIEPPDVAVGYRVQVGASQWLFYRSLAEQQNRTVLGHNLTTEFLAARFSTSGEVAKLVEVENE